MGQFFETIPEYLVKWILQQKMFWVATSPLSASGHVNVSPKGGLYFGLIDDKTFWYMDLSGSGNETISHLYEPRNGRITVMFNSFDGSPRIVRLFGHGTVFERGAQAFDDFTKKHDVKVIPSSRSIIVVKVHQVASSCGYSVPFFEFRNFRTTLNEVFAKREKRFEEGKSEERRDRFVVCSVNRPGVRGLSCPVSDTGRSRTHTAWTACPECTLDPRRGRRNTLPPSRRWSARWRHEHTETTANSTPGTSSWWPPSRRCARLSPWLCSWPRLEAPSAHCHHRLVKRWRWCLS